MPTSPNNAEDLARQYSEERECYRANLFKFSRDVLGFREMRLQPHFELCEFLAHARGNGSNRSSNLRTFPLEGNHRAGRPDKRRLLVLEPRGFFKTSICTVAYPIWRWASNPNLRVLLVSHNTEKAAEILAGIQEKLKSPVLRELFGDLAKGYYIKGKDKAKWNKLEVQLWDPGYENLDGTYGRLVPLDHTMASGRAVGMETQIASVHCDICILDDLVNEQNVKGEEGLEKPAETLQFIEPIVNPGGEIVVVGTRYSFRDAYGKLLNNGTYDVILRSAINEDGTPHFPSRFPLEEIKSAEKNMGPDKASSQLYNDPGNPTDAKFDRAWIDRCIVPAGTWPDNLKDLVPKAYLDFALSQSRRSDYTARVVGVNAGNAYWLLEADERKQNVDRICDDVFRMDQAYSGLEIGFEANAFQGLFSNIFEREERERDHKLRSLRPIVHSTKVKKEHRIMRLVPLIQSGQIKIQDSMTDLIAELMRYPKWHDDLLDALEELVHMLGPIEGQAPVGKTDQEQLMDRMREQMRVPITKPRKLTFHAVFGGFQ